MLPIVALTQLLQPAYERVEPTDELPEILELGDRPEPIEIYPGLWLVGHGVHTGLAPGAESTATLFWSVSDPNLPDLKIRLQLMDRAGSIVWNESYWPDRNGSTSTWIEGKYYKTRFALTPIADTVYGSATLEVEAAPIETIESSKNIIQLSYSILGWQRTVNADNFEDRAVLNVYPQSDAYYEFETGLTLEGYSLSSTEIQTDDTLHIKLVWRASSMEGLPDYTAFIHILNSRRELVSQQDSPPLDGKFPTSLWHTTNRSIVEERTLDLNLDPGTYTVYMGLYSWPDLERLEITQNGESLGDALKLADIQVNE
ncbi:MAG: hypothetical protein AAF633_23330 [Chloroflexota bacterium]